MYELVRVTDRVYYIECPAKIGVIVDDNCATLIDSGGDKDTGKRILRILEAQGWTLSAILNTHSHADHIGGNAFLQSRTGCEIYAPETELAFVQNPFLEPSFLYGGTPPSELCHKFLLAKESLAKPLCDKALPRGTQIIPLSGHSFNMVGFKVDGILFLADALSSKATLEKYQIGVLFDVAQYLQTLESVKNMSAELFIPSHADTTEDIAPLAQFNIDKVYEISAVICDLCEKDIAFEPLLCALFRHYKLQMSALQHALVGAALRAYLTWLCDTDRLAKSLTEDGIFYRKK